MKNPYKVILLDTESRTYGVQYKDKKYQKIGFPESWGTRHHAQKYMASLLGLTLEDFKTASFN